ncbi:YIP1 family protein [Aureisphaera galaxeae]|uniref:YIP1 family protein n=1 Tax=Aureisphaera galaxeae TaxID=1538023 RepID=UPI0023506D64|nr:YIP1 family protein [Aureisphaera galaxeae]MDC8003837.1 YIP1 family protein [Aureisphaera galaxeae]
MEESSFEEFEKEYLKIDPNKLFQSIWSKPKVTLEYVLHTIPTKHVTILFVLGGIVRNIGRATQRGLGDNMSTMVVLASSVFLGAFFGWIGYYIYAWALSALGKLLGGAADPEKMRTVLAWSLVPSIASLLLLIPQLIIFGDDLFRSYPLNDSTFYSTLWMVFGILELILSIWSIVILVIGIRLVQSFNIGFAILNMLLPIFAILIPLALLAILAS